VGLFLPNDLVDSDPAKIEARQRLHALVAAHLTADGVLFDSPAWIVTARKER